MKASEANLLGFLQNSPQFVILIYQRTYSRTDKQCRQLWDDILRGGSSDTVAVQSLQTLDPLNVDILAVILVLSMDHSSRILALSRVSTKSEQDHPVGMTARSRFSATRRLGFNPRRFRRRGVTRGHKLKMTGFETT